MIPRLVPEISPLDAFCDVAGVVVVVGIVILGDGLTHISMYILKYISTHISECYFNFVLLQR